MNPADDLKKLARLMDDYDLHLQSVLAGTENKAARAQLETIHAKFAAGKTQFVAEYQKALAKADQQITDAKQRAEKVKQQVEAAREKLAAPRPEKPAAPPPAADDPALGQKLSAELLNWHGVVASSKDTMRSGDIWQALQSWKE